jgi:hypothetical protein
VTENWRKRRRKEGRERERKEGSKGYDDGGWVSIESNIASS